MASPATDVWYSFVPTGNSLDIIITGGINQPNIGVWTGNCGALIGAGCDIGNGGNLTTTIAQVTPGQTYYIQISGGNVNDQGVFDLTLQNNNSCDDCLLTSNMVVSQLQDKVQHHLIILGLTLVGILYKHQTILMGVIQCQD